MSLKIEKKKMKKGVSFDKSPKKLKKHKINGKKKSKDPSFKKHKKSKSQKPVGSMSNNQEIFKKPNLNMSLSPKKHKKIRSNQNLTPKLEKVPVEKKEKVKVSTKILQTEQAAEKLEKLSEQELLQLSKKIRNKLEKRKLRKSKNLNKDLKVTKNKDSEVEDSGIKKSVKKADDEVRSVTLASDLSTEILKKQLELRQLKLKKQALEKLAEIATKNEVKEPLKPAKKVKRLVGIKGKNKFSNLKSANLEKKSKNSGIPTQADQIKERIKEIEQRKTLSKTAKRKLSKLKASLKLQEGGISNKEGSSQFSVRVIEQQVTKNDSDIGQKKENKIIETELIIGGKSDSKNNAENVDTLTKNKKQHMKKKSKKNKKLDMIDFKVDALKKDEKTKQKKKSKKNQKEEGEITEVPELEKLINVNSPQNDLELKNKKKKKKQLDKIENTPSPLKRKLEESLDDQESKAKKKKKKHHKEEEEYDSKEKSKKKKKQKRSPEKIKLEDESEEKKKKYHREEENDLNDVEETTKKALLELQSDEPELKSKKENKKKKKHHKERENDSSGADETPKKKQKQNGSELEKNDSKKTPEKKEDPKQSADEEEDLTQFVDLELEKIYPTNDKNTPRKKRKQIQFSEENKISSENQSDGSKSEEKGSSDLKKKQNQDIVENQCDNSKLEEKGTPKKKKNQQKQFAEEEQQSNDVDLQSIKKESASKEDKIFENDDMELSGNSSGDSKESKEIEIKQENSNVATNESDKNDENKPPMALTGVAGFINNDLKKLPNNIHNQTPKKKRYVLFVGNLAYTATTVDVKKHFLTKVSKVVDVRIPRSRDSNMQRGFGYIEVESQEDFEKALSMHNTFIRGRKIAVQYTTSGSKRALNKAEVVGKNQKLHALRKAGKLAGSHNYNSTRSFRRKVQQGKADKPSANANAVKQEN